MRPSVALNMHRDAVRALVAAHGTTNPRVFGSVAAGTDTETSDLDLLVDLTADTSAFALFELSEAIVQMLGVPVDLATPNSVSKFIRRHVLASACRL